MSLITFVLATPISGPALMCIPQWVSRDIEDPTVLVIPRHNALRSRQYFKASIVSAVSPDCDTKTHTSSRNIGIFLSKKSLASSTLIGNSVNSSKTARV
jgi:hypothetical protein